ncbi:phenylacetate--CoA ligase family protein [Deinococcus radiotolerans]|uniref:Capsular polysaccharide biosynthesis protein n=1 Tax=Deinococcus radiotolerans TaxID=1309407 RepID=A0ABQ2FN16_9DEIO|nr:phenylacetate--CoA ligase family protein [Deinococcus radiotolerans]GGL09558.1 capsular polysaccharide biosynthesis protein [Deinococcus radiotolerans]
MGLIHRMGTQLYFQRLDERYARSDFLHAQQFAPPPNWQAQQQDRLLDLLTHAQAQVPYYRRLLAERGVTQPGQLTAQTLQTLPVLTKRELRDEFGDLQALDAGVREGFRNSSGGSTGQPTIFMQDREFTSWAEATKQLFDGWAGFQTGERRVRLWGSSRDLFSGANWRRQLGQAVMNERWLNAFEMTPETMDRYLQVIHSFRPELLLGYCDALVTLARHMHDRGLRVHPPRAVMSSAGNLFPAARQAVAEAFGAPVFDRYGSREVGDLACECGEGTLHLNPWTHFVEILDDQGRALPPGEVGRITVTLLSNYTMPLLRYDIGDLGALAPAGTCACGRSLPALSGLHGRTADCFILPSGSRVMSEAMIHLICVDMVVPGVKKFQVVQHAPDKVTLKLVTYAGQPLTPDEEDRLRQGLKRILLHEVTPDLEYCQRIPPSPSGKYRYTVSMLPEGAAEHLPRVGPGRAPLQS